MEDYKNNAFLKTSLNYYQKLPILNIGGEWVLINEECSVLNKHLSNNKIR